jgi:hypothetical protein
MEERGGARSVVKTSKLGGALSHDPIVRLLRERVTMRAKGG